MKSLFITTEPDPKALVSAWDSWNEPATHIPFRWMGPSIDSFIISRAKSEHFDVIFYVGAAGGSGLPSFSTFRTLKGIAKIIHLCWDSTDYPWHQLLKQYKDNECFDLQVGIDGPIDAPVDHATLTPINPLLFDSTKVDKNIRCGFSGGVRPKSPRGNILFSVNGLTLRQRTNGSYKEYAEFIKRCRMVINVSNTGTDTGNHIKMRVLESAFAKSALLELDTPIAKSWFPEESLFYYKDADSASEIVRYASDSEIEKKSKMLYEIVITKYTPKLIYRNILDKVGL